MKKAFSLILIVILFFLFMPEFADSINAQEKEEKAQSKKGEEDTEKPKEEQKKEAKPTTDIFFGLGFGYAIGVTVFKGERKHIEEALIINGKLRILESKNTIARLMLETHYFFPCPWFHKQEKVGIGPFFALEISGKKIPTYGTGLMFGFRHQNDSKKSFNIGIGVFRDQNFRTLGDGFIENQNVPEGESMVRFREPGYWGWMFIFSFSY